MKVSIRATHFRDWMPSVTWGRRRLRRSWILNIFLQPVGRSNADGGNAQIVSKTGKPCPKVLTRKGEFLYGVWMAEGKPQLQVRNIIQNVETMQLSLPKWEREW